MQFSEDEAERLASLVRYGVLDTDFEESFDRLTRLAAKLFNTPISLVSLVDKDRQWFKSAHGLNARETPRSVAFCAHAILGDDVFIVPNANNDERFKDNPLVTDDPHVCFYAGAPLKTPDGYNLGTFCVIDHEPRDGLNDSDQKALTDFAETVIEILEQKRSLRSLSRDAEKRESNLRKIDQLASGSLRKDQGTLAGDMELIKKLATKS